jgi:hypothetical protein
MHTTPKSTAARVQSRFAQLERALAQHVSSLSVHPAQKYPGIAIMQPGFYFRELTAEEKGALLRAKRELDDVVELTRLLLQGAQSSLAYDFKNAAAALSVWVGDGLNYSVHPDQAETLRRLHTAFEQMRKIVGILSPDATAPPLLVPDTNALIHFPDPSQYEPIAACQSFILLLLPTVLGELDDLKNNHRNPEFRDKVKSVITRIKGWRTQGSLRDGVTVQKTITVRTTHQEPNMSMTLPWLDPNVRDDRIVAAVLELQKDHADAPVVLVTEDVNLHNKAEAAAIQVTDTDLCLPQPAALMKS